MKKIFAMLAAIFFCGAMMISCNKDNKEEQPTFPTKADILLLSVEQLLNFCPDWHYFNSYEILMDELRDYRFYARDMCHPSDLAVDIIWQHFQETHMTPATIQQNILNTKKAKQSLHTPIISNP